VCVERREFGVLLVSSRGDSWVYRSCVRSGERNDVVEIY